jgi:hypothetical protein
VFNINGKKYTYFLEVFIINELFEDMEEENITFEKSANLLLNMLLMTLKNIWNFSISLVFLKLT